MNIAVCKSGCRIFTKRLTGRSQIPQGAEITQNIVMFN